jgi:glycosyltransferase involved in cell wall biosynthesis
VLEGFAAGVPVVCSRSSSLPEIAGNAALLFDPTNPAELAACFARLVASPALGDSLVAAGKTQLQRFSWNKTASQTLTVFEKAVVHHYASTSDSGVALSDEVNSYLGDAETVKRTAIPT